MRTETSLLDTFLPVFDVREHHEIVVAASPDATYAAARAVDLGGSLPAKTLFLVRLIPHLLTGKATPSASLTLDTALAMGFTVLAEEPGTELVLGVVGRFWRLDSGLRKLAADDFVAFDEPGYAKACMNFRVSGDATISILETETRVLCTDDSARRKFALYWTAIGPFSAVIRKIMLGTIKENAEAE
jgi:hypothetical protein